MKTLLVVALVLLSGCASHARYKKAVYTWINEDVEYLHEVWGYPDGSYKRKDGTTAYIYSSASSHYVPGRVTASASEIMGHTFIDVNQTPGFSVNLSCKTVFYADKDGIIFDVGWQGNNCVK